MKVLRFHSAKPKFYTKWKTIINRQNFNVTSSTRVCSNHFQDGQPTEKNPHPSLYLKGYNITVPTKRKPLIKHELPGKRKKVNPPEASATSSSHLTESYLNLDHSYMPSQEEHVSDVNLETFDEQPAGFPTNSDGTSQYDSPTKVGKTSSYSLMNLQKEHGYVVQPHQSEDKVTLCVDDDHIDKCGGCSSCLQKLMDQVENLTMQNEQLGLDLQQSKDAIEKLQMDLKTESVFGIHKIRNSESLMKVYTGLTSYDKFEWLFNTVAHNLPNLKYYRGEMSCRPKRYQAGTSKKPGPKRKLDHQNELLLTLVKLKLDLLEDDLAFRFNISTSLVSQILSTWIPLLAKELEGLIYWPSREEINQYYPACFKKWPNVKVIIDCTEVPLQRPSLAKANAQIYSSYKGRPTAKALVGCTPGGTISFISKIAGGSMSDKKLVEKSHIVDKFEPNDVCMADRGFNIQDILAPHMVHLVIPPFLKKGKQLSVKDNIKTKTVANARIHIERVIGRLKEFRILNGELPLDMLPLIDNIFIICGALVNLQPPMVPMET